MPETFVQIKWEHHCAETDEDVSTVTIHRVINMGYYEYPNLACINCDVVPVMAARNTIKAPDTDS